MFPPIYTEDLHVLLRRLWESLKRAVDHWTENYAVMPGEEEHEVVVALQLAQKLPKGAKPHITNYIRGYMHDSGWLTNGFRYYRNRVSFHCVPAVRYPEE